MLHNKNACSVIGLWAKAQARGPWPMGPSPWALAYGPWPIPPPDRCPDRRPPARGAQALGPGAQI